MSKHTPEPLAYEIVPSDQREQSQSYAEWTGLYIGPADDEGKVLHTIFEGGFTHGPEDGDPEADAQRLIACWNACTGIPTEALKQGSMKKLLEVLEESEEYFDQRADAEYFTDSPAPHPNEEMRLLCMINEALASFKEEG